MTSDPVTPMAFAFFSLEKLSKPQAAALFLTLDEKPARRHENRRIKSKSRSNWRKERAKNCV